MRIEYFQLIDRIVDLDLAQQTIRTEARVPSASTIFEGHFPGYPLMPGVLLIEAMAQTSGWLVIAVTKFSRMPFFAALKEVKLRSFVHPGQNLSLSAKLLHEGSGYAVTKADIRCDGKMHVDLAKSITPVEIGPPEPPSPTKVQFDRNVVALHGQVNPGPINTAFPGTTVSAADHRHRPLSPAA